MDKTLMLLNFSALNADCAQEGNKNENTISNITRNDQNIIEGTVYNSLNLINHN